MGQAMNTTTTPTTSVADLHLKITGEVVMLAAIQAARTAPCPDKSDRPAQKAMEDKVTATLMAMNPTPDDLARLVARSNLAVAYMLLTAARVAEGGER
jgi:hypothetical protein